MALSLKDNPSRPLKILIVGRTRLRLRGGIARSVAMLNEALSSINGNVVELADIRSKITRSLNGYDAMMHYGELDLVEQHLAAARASNVMVLLNSTFDGTVDRTKWIQSNLAKWNKSSGSDVRMIVFSEAAKDDPRMSAVIDRLVVMPKTIRSYSKPLRSWRRRAGICIGELAKLERGRLVRGIDVDSAIAALRRAVPGAPIRAYNQYGTPQTRRPKGVDVFEYTDDGFLEWLGTNRIHASLTRWETFSMVPLEAQMMGTPVLTRVMHQSLSEYLGPTAVTWRTLDELSLATSLIYNDIFRWANVSKAGMLNASAVSCKHIAPMLDISIRKALLAR